jgi:hypothetical protein
MTLLFLSLGNEEGGHLKSNINLATRNDHPWLIGNRGKRTYEVFEKGGEIPRHPLNSYLSSTPSYACFPLLHLIFLVKIPLQTRRSGVRVAPAVSWTLHGA